MCFCSVETVSFSEVKWQETQCRMAAARQVRRRQQAAVVLQYRASLVVAKWRITNLNQVADS